MNEEKQWALWFQSVPGIGRKTIYHLEEHFGSLKQAAAAPEDELCQILRTPQIKSLREFSQTPDALMRQCERAGAEYVTVSDDCMSQGESAQDLSASQRLPFAQPLCFPERLRQIPDPPFGIFVKGTLPDPKKPAVAIIGARACSAYGRETARMMGVEAAAAGIQVISGMARGIDSLSQKACLDAGGKSFAVLGSGVNVCYPPEARPLYEQLSDSGGLISEYPLNMQPVTGNFPPRNRLISGLADLVLVIEAREKSGTLITVDMALEQGKEVAVVPGRITDALSQGCHRLYQQGANLVTSPQQMAEMVWEAFAVKWKKAGSGAKTGKTDRNAHFPYRMGDGIDICAREGKNAPDPSLSPFLNHLLSLLDTTPQPVEALYRSFQENDGRESLPDFLAGLLELELAGKCRSVGGMYAGAGR